MPRNVCPWLNALGELLQQKYAIRNKLIGRDYATGELAQAENALMAVHQAIAHHRSHCPQCSLHENAEALSA
jgi:hypothetical protein